MSYVVSVIDTSGDEEEIAEQVHDESLNHCLGKFMRFVMTYDLTGPYYIELGGQSGE